MPRRSALAAAVITLCLSLMIGPTLQAAGTAPSTGAHRPPVTASHSLARAKKKHGHQVKRTRQSRNASSHKGLQHRRRIHKRVGAALP